MATGSLRQRYAGSWSIILDLGYETDPETGKRRRRQKWITFRGTRKEAEARKAKLVTEQNEGTFVEPSKVTLMVADASAVLKAEVPPPPAGLTLDRLPSLPPAVRSQAR